MKRQIVIEIDEAQKKMVDAIMELPPQVENDLISAIRHGTPLPKGHGDLIDRSKLDICPIDITDLPLNKCLMVYCEEDIDNAPTIIEADKCQDDCEHCDWVTCPVEEKEGE